MREQNALSILIQLHTISLLLLLPPNPKALNYQASMYILWICNSTKANDRWSNQGYKDLSICERQDQDFKGLAANKRQYKNIQSGSPVGMIWKIQNQKKCIFYQQHSRKGLWCIFYKIAGIWFHVVGLIVMEFSLESKVKVSLLGLGLGKYGLLLAEIILNKGLFPDLW